MRALQRRWVADCAVAAPLAAREVVDDVGHDLLTRWSEEHRRYHGLTHLSEVLAALDRLCATRAVSAEDATVAALAAWFHDAVYSVTPATPDRPGTSGAAAAARTAAVSNEAASADLAEHHLSALGVAAATRQRVTASVLDTEHHDLGSTAGEDPARVLLHDADLWILAAPVVRFDEYCAQVRAEYAHVPAAVYARERSAVLRPFLARDSVYRTEYARSTWGSAARENLARELTRLAG